MKSTGPYCSLPFGHNGNCRWDLRDKEGGACNHPYVHWVGSMAITGRFPSPEDDFPVGPSGPVQPEQVEEYREAWRCSHCGARASEKCTPECKAGCL